MRRICIKNIVTTDVVNKYIPLIMAVLGVTLNTWMNMSFTPEILLGGLVSGLASTGLYEAFKNFLKSKEGMVHMSAGDTEFSTD